MSDMLVVTSKVKAKIKQKELRTSAEFIEKLSQHVELLLEKAAERAMSSKRKTVTADDFAP